LGATSTQLRAKCELFGCLRVPKMVPLAGERG
jgi:hypothetical protein